MRLSYDPELLDELHDIAIAAGREAGRTALAGQREGVTVAATKSSATDIVTEMDRRTEALLVDRILSQRPDDGVVGEEGSDHVGETGVRWILDPIDGTVNYLYDQPSWAVSIAAEIDGQVVVGVVVAPVLEETYVAVAGRGARLHDADGVRTLRVNDPVELPTALVATGFGYTKERRTSQARVVAGVIPQVRDVRRLGACSIDLCHVAAGRVDAYYERGPQAWDLAAGGLVAQEAGARVEGLHGALAGDELILAAGPHLFRPLHDLLDSLGADRD
ncbi:MAG TPA: inositol monophosphatase family protein [Candidatus Nanopelagicales bacterium]|nr:inositol monophosphatase family protein [Candidatus Nanopelagicales bacterium]